jgi:hypothetical protein
MKSKKRLTITGVVLAVLLLMGTAAKADAFSVSFSLAQPYQTTDVGTLSFVATITNLGNETVFLNGDNLFVGLPLAGDDTPFYLNFPLSLSDGDSATAELFTITIPGGTPNGLYTGSFVLLGGADDSSQLELGSVDYNVNVAGTVNVTPEPYAFLLMGTGLLGLGRLVRRRLLG